LKFIDVAYLDETYNDLLPNGNRVLMSVEVDANDKPVAYYLTTPAGDFSLPARERIARKRVPADEIIHSFLVTEDESQARGITWFHSALLDAKNLQGYRDATITSARIAACNMGFIKPPVTTEQAYEGDDPNMEPKLPPEIMTEPGAFWEMPEGWEVQQFDPKQPTQNHAEFYKSIMQDLAVGLDVNYFSLSSDLGSVNYSSARVGLLDERDIWRTLQQFVIDHFCRAVYQEFLSAAFLGGALGISLAEYKALENPNWRARGWGWVDPQKEINAQVTAIENGLTSRTDILAEQGRDFRTLLETLKAEESLLEEFGIGFSTAKQPAPPADDKDEDDDAKAAEDQPPDEGRGHTNGKWVS
jgi:lambda family phage portal protein